MPLQPLRTSMPPVVPQVPRPLYPTVVVAAFKGGVGKTAVAVALAELLGHQGLKVLLVITDSQQDARYRLDREGKHRVRRGAGSVRTLLLRGPRLPDLLYRSGAVSVGLKDEPDVVVVDTPPSLEPSSLPGVTLVVPVDGAGATQRNVLAMLPRVPENTFCVLLGTSMQTTETLSVTSEDWRTSAEDLLSGLPESRFTYVEDVLKFSNEVAVAHDDGRSVWELPRHPRSRTASFLAGISAVCCDFFARSLSGRQWLGEPTAPKSPVFIPGYDD